MSQASPSTFSVADGPALPPSGVAGEAYGGSVEVAAEGLLASLETLARDLEGQPEALLQLLRRLEQLHRAIQDGPFRASLPADRNALFQLLSEMERSGGWSYIPRLQLRTFLDLLGAKAPAEAPIAPTAGSEDGGLGGESSPIDADSPGSSSRLAA